MRINIKNFIFQNIGIRQTILKNTLWLVLAEVVAKMLSLVSVVYIARILGATEYGKFTFAFSFVSVMAILSDVGIIDISTREFSRNKENEKKFSGIFTLELMLCVCTFIITVMSSFFITSDYRIRVMIWILILYILSNSLLGVIFSFLRARQKMEYEAVIRISQSVISTLAVFFVIFYVPSPQNLSFGYMISSVILLFFVIIFFSIFFQRLSLRWERSSFNILKMSWPLSLGFVGFWVYASINSVMLGYFNLITENGWYNAAFKITIVASIPAELAIRSFYPMLSNFFVQSKEKLQKTWEYILELMTLIAVPLVIGGMVMAPKIIDFLYGQSFAPSIFALQLLMFIVGISLIIYPFAIILIVTDHQKQNFIFIILGAMINVILNFIFIPIYGFYGTILGTIIASIIVLCVIIIFLKYNTKIILFNQDFLKTVLVSVLSSGIMYFTIRYRAIYNLNVIFVCFLGAVFYIISTVLLYRIIFQRKITNLIFKN